MIEKLKNVMQDRFWIMPATPKFVENGIPYITSKNIKMGKIDFSKISYISSEDYNIISKNRPILVGDILVSMIGTLGEVAEVTSNDGVFYGQNMFLIRLDENHINKRYFMNYFKSDFVKRSLASRQNQSTQKYLKANHIEELLINIPSLTIQNNIAKKLDLIENIIGQKKDQLFLLDDLIKSRFVEMFGDLNVEFRYDSFRFKEIVNNMTKGPFGSDMKKDLFVPRSDDTYKVYIQANAIQKNQDIGDYYISKEYFESKVFRFEVHPGDYIITCDGTLGKYLKLDQNMERGVISPSLLRLTLNEEKMTREYFENVWDIYMLPLMKKKARNACLVHLPSAKVIEEISIPIPPYVLQLSFTKFVQQIDKSKFSCLSFIR